MNLHEYQAKEIFERYGLPVSKRSLIKSESEIDDAINQIDFSNGCVAKVQAHTGGRGKVGGVKLCKNKADIEAFVNQWLGKNIITIQTDELGLPVQTISLEELTDIEKELYMSFVVDRDEKCVSMIVSEAGGMNIEEVAEKTPEKILKGKLNHEYIIEDQDIIKLSNSLGFNQAQHEQFKNIVDGCSKLFKDLDLSLLEINPLVVKVDGNLHCLDAKINIDENALYRQTELEAMRDASQEDEREYEAKLNDLSYVALDGNIGCMVNGAGLAMGTMDIIQLHGGSPANFLDVGGGATKERVAKAFSIILQDPNVKVILVNIFGGIMKCDIIAEGVVAAAKELSIQVPLVVRLEGTNVDLGKEILNKSGLAIISADNLEDAAQKAVGALS